MLAIALLALIACEDAASIKFKRVNQNYDRGLINFNTEIYSHKVDILDKKMETIIRREGNLNKEIIDIKRRQEDLNRQMENIKKQKDGLRKKSEFLFRQKEQLEREMETLNADIARINGYKKNHARAIVEGNEFKITIYLSGYNEEDIIVKSKKGLVIVQAIHTVPGKLQSHYLNVRILPDFVEGSGKWLYMWGVLNIVFPIIQTQNKYPKSTIPFGIDEMIENKKPNKFDQKAPATKISESTDVPNLENGVKANYFPNQDEGVEVITKTPIEYNVKEINKMESQENSKETNTYIPY